MSLAKTGVEPVADDPELLLESLPNVVDKVNGKVKTLYTDKTAIKVLTVNIDCGK